MCFSVANALALHALIANYYHTCHVLSKLLWATIDHYFVVSYSTVYTCTFNISLRIEEKCWHKAQLYLSKKQPGPINHANIIR